jgi:L-ascorbate 6-phosphate lactonase
MVTEFEPAPGSVLMVWLGQAGFLLKTSRGELLLIDPYLSNDAETTHRLSRVCEAPLRAESVTPDLLLVTHAHVDHLDPTTVRAFAANGHTTLLGSPAVCSTAREACGWTNRWLPLSAGDSTTVLDTRVDATWNRHGELDDTESVGFRVEIDGLHFWHTGDTEYDARLHRPPLPDVDVAFLPINGTGGNMNALEAALLSSQVNPKVAVPMHFGMWSNAAYSFDDSEPWATLDPMLFVQTLERLSPTSACHVPTVGEMVTVSRTTTALGKTVTVDTVLAHG